MMLFAPPSAAGWPRVLLIVVLLSGGPAWLPGCEALDYIVEPGPEIIATKGAIWPKPRAQTSWERFLTVRPHSFRFNLVNNTCDILNEAIRRYASLITSAFYATRRSAVQQLQQQSTTASRLLSSSRHNRLYEGTLDSLNVDLKAPCEDRPYLNMDESYHLHVLTPTDAVLEAFSVWGVLRGLESFSQLLTPVSEEVLSLRLNATTIDDAPRFAHRGLLLDTGRHFMPPTTIRTLLDGMAYTKLNVFHWHIVDDQSFPYQSQRYPELSARGAFHPQLAVYTPTDVADLVEYARLRGIRVLIELDTPGHTRSWGVAHPELLTQCGGDWTGKLGPIDPSAPGVYEFVGDLIGELAALSHDRYVHLGGDEVGFKCWRSNANITAYMQRHGLATYEQLEQHYVQQIVDIASHQRLGSIVWEEVFTNGVRLDAERTVVHVWMPAMAVKLAEVTARNLSAIASSCWYLDHLDTGPDWQKFYECDPHAFDGTDGQKRLVIGGEACMWSESVNAVNVVQRVFPRACAAAEKLWSDRSATDGAYEEARHRLEEHTCRMNKRGVDAQPANHAGYCY